MEDTRMLSHLLGILALLGASVLALLGLGVGVFALARGNRRLAGRALLATAGFAVLYLAGTTISGIVAPSRVLPPGRELAFCGFDCHLHVSVAGSVTVGDRIRVAVRVRSDAKAAPEFPSYLQYRLVGADFSLVVPVTDPAAFAQRLEAGASYVDTLEFSAPAAGAPYSLRVKYPDLPEALLIGPANGRARGKTTLALEGRTP
jgi:hypothetical protein